MHKFGPKPKFVHIFSSVSITFCIMQAAEQIRSWGLQPVVGPHTTSLNEPCAHRLLLATPESGLLSFDIEGGKHFYDIEKEHPQIMK